MLILLEKTMFIYWDIFAIVYYLLCAIAICDKFSPTSTQIMKCTQCCKSVKTESNQETHQNDYDGAASTLIKCVAA